MPVSPVCTWKASQVSSMVDSRLELRNILSFQKRLSSKQKFLKRYVYPNRQYKYNKKSKDM